MTTVKLLTRQLLAVSALSRENILIPERNVFTFKYINLHNLNFNPTDLCILGLNIVADAFVIPLMSDSG